MPGLGASAVSDAAHVVVTLFGGSSTRGGPTPGAVQFLREKGQREARPGIFLWLDPGEGRGWGPSAKGRDPGEGQDQYR